MCFRSVVVASNILVQYPVEGHLGSIPLSDILTWGAFTYPVAFLVTDLTNRIYGPGMARKVIVGGFAAAVTLSVFLATPRLAVASGTAFLVGQLLDVTIFNRLRQSAWWKAPWVGSILGSVVDTTLFFTLAFAASFAILGVNDPFASETMPLLSVMATEAPRWVSWAIGDLMVKVLVAIVALGPYRVVMNSRAQWKPVVG